MYVSSNQTGPNTQLAIAGSPRDYTFSAWVNPLDVGPGKPVVLAVEVGGVPVLQVDEEFENLQPGWQLIERTIPAASFSGNATIKVSSRGSSQFYVDDIRFYPADGYLNTFYYDYRLLQEIAAVGMNNDASYSEYDYSGRLVADYGEDENGVKALFNELLIQQFVYYLYDEGIVHFDPERGWSWREATLASAEVPGGAVGLLTAKISRLPHAVASALELAHETRIC